MFELITTIILQVRLLNYYSIKRLHLEPSIKVIIIVITAIIIVIVINFIVIISLINDFQNHLQKYLNFRLPINFFMNHCYFFLIKSKFY